MPPSSSRRPRTRRVDSSPPLNSSLPDSSPSRPRAKRRKVQERGGPKLIATDGPLSPEGRVNEIIRTFSIAEDGAVVARQYANERNYEQNSAGITAYAKVAGQDWTYYIRDLVVRIGRPPDTHNHRPPTASSASTTATATPPPEEVHIDLGPSKFISRNHAVISYDMDGGHDWQMLVLGRNGVKVDGETFKRESTITLRSGSVIDIGGTEMMFVLPNKDPEISPEILSRIHVHQYQMAMIDDEVGLPPIQTAGIYGHGESPPTPTHSRQGLKHRRSEVGEQAGGRGNEMTPMVVKREDQGKVAAGGREMVVELPAGEVDYSLDEAKDIKPPYSYALLIAQAILSSETEQLTLASIYQFIMEKYAFYRHVSMGWQNSIRHNLSLNKAFRKIPRRTDEPGKGMKWELLPENREEYITKLRKMTKQTHPTHPTITTTTTTRSEFHLGSPSPRKTLGPPISLDDSPSSALSFPPGNRSITPPPNSSYPIRPTEAYTPDRGSRNPTTGIHSTKPLNLQPLSTPKTTNHHHLIPPASVHPTEDPISPVPPLAASTAVTPAPQRQHPRLAPPSASQLPSSYLPTSSPAPFWKYVSFGSTPAKPDDRGTRAPGIELNFSPLKDLQSSSPPPMIPPRPEDSAVRRVRELGSPLKDRGGGGGGEEGGGVFTFTTPTKTAGVGVGGVVGVGEDEEEAGGLGDFMGVDLTRGFEKIGKFHMKTSASRSGSLGSGTMMTPTSATSEGGMGMGVSRNWPAGV